MKAHVSRLVLVEKGNTNRGDGREESERKGDSASHFKNLICKGLNSR